jgi:hypothetical protein
MSVERVPVRIYPDDIAASRAVARRVADCIRRKNAEGRPTVLGLPEYHALEAFVRWPIPRSAHAAEQLEKP